MRKATDAKLVVVIDDDLLVLEATAGLLRRWGCEVVPATSYGEALGRLSAARRRPDLIICDYHLADGANGVETIESLRSVFEIPALLISGDATSPDGHEYSLLHKPVDPSKFKAALIGASVLQP